MVIKMEMIGTGASKTGESGRERGLKNYLLGSTFITLLGDGFTRSPYPRIMQYIHITNLHMYSQTQISKEVPKKKNNNEEKNHTKNEKQLKLIIPLTPSSSWCP